MPFAMEPAGHGSAPSGAPPSAQGRARFEEHTAAILQKKQQSVATGVKCGTCWLRRAFCICDAAKAVPLGQNIRFLVYMSREDYLSGGDDAKLLQLAAPGRTTIFVHGRAGDDAALRAAVAAGDRKNTALLFPSDTAVDATGWLRERGFGSRAAAPPAELSSSSSSSSSAAAVAAVAAASEEPPLLTVMVVDGVWAKARRMQTHLAKRVLPADVLTVILSAAVVEKLNDGSSVYGRGQSKPGRMCTVEAIALFLGEAGEGEATIGGLVDLLLLNNEGLAGKVQVAEKAHWKTDGPHYGHPAWYFGRSLGETVQKSKYRGGQD